MNALTTIARDEIRVFLGDIPAEEYQARAKLRSYRNAATAMIAATHSDTARALAWQVIDWASPFLFDRAAPVELLDRLNVLASRLLKTAMTAEEIDALLQEAAGHDR